MDEPIETRLRKAAQDCLDAMETTPDDVVGAASVLRLRAMLAAVEIDRLRAERDALLAKVAELEARPMVVTGDTGFEVVA